MIRKHTLLIFFCILIIDRTFSQSENNYSERIKMNLTYQWGLVNMPTGELQFNMQKSDNSNLHMINAELRGSSLKNFEFIYKFDSYHRSCFYPENNQICNFGRKVSQNGKVFEEMYDFDKNRNRIYSKIIQENQSMKYDTLVLKKDIFDFLSASYYLRKLKYEKMASGQKVPITVLLENQLYTLNVKFLGIERISIAQGNNYVCYKVSIQVIGGSVFNEGDEIFAWISADNKRLPVQFEARILIGSVKAVLSEVEYPKSAIMSLRNGY